MTVCIRVKIHDDITGLTSVEDKILFIVCLAEFDTEEASLNLFHTGKIFYTPRSPKTFHKFLYLTIATFPTVFFPSKSSR